MASTNNNDMGKASLAIGFMADVLYLKGVINDLEAEAIYNVKYPAELDEVLQNITKEVYKSEGKYFRNRL